MSAAALALKRVSPRRLASEALRRMPPHVKRRALALAAVCVALTALYQLWFRDSSLVEVHNVQVTGLTTSDAKRVQAALVGEAKTMTTLHVDRGALERAIEPYPVVREIEVQPDFPHGLRIHVIQYQAAAIAVSGSMRMPVAGDGTVLRGIRIDGRLPHIDVNGPIGPKALDDPVALGAAAVAGAAPAVLRARIDHVDRTGKGYVATLRDGPDLIFGRATELRSKWAAAARVLADLDARGATYVDLRLPSRPAVGGLAATTVTPVAPADLIATPSAGTTSTASGAGSTAAGATSTDSTAGSTTSTTAATPTTSTTPPSTSQSATTDGSTTGATTASGGAAVAP